MQELDLTEAILVTGGAGFIGSHFVDLLLSKHYKVIVLDLLTYAGNLENLADAYNNSNFVFVKGDIANKVLVSKLLKKYNISKVFNFAAESHVDNSIKDPEVFILTNILGTSRLMSACLEYWTITNKMDEARFIHISTDEVFGELMPNQPAFTELSSYAPNSPYSASKAGSDHLVRAWNKTYGLPTIITYCSNNFGPRQHFEKLIPNMIRCAVSGKLLPVYGTGNNIRDWLYVKDHCQGILLAAQNGKVGETYCFGGNNQISNINLVKKICNILDKLMPKDDKTLYGKLIDFVKDRPGHDLRYHIDYSKAAKDLGYSVNREFDALLEQTIIFYLNIRHKLR